MTVAGRTYLHTRPLPDGSTLLALFTAELPCGCAAYSGIKAPANEAAMILEECGPDHREAAGRAITRLRTMPPSDRDACELAMEILAEELVEP